MLKPPEASGPAPHVARPAGELTESPFKGKTGLVRILHAFFNSIAGLADAWRHESAFRQEILLAIVLIPAACWIP
ncbi:MAG TPA: diacylglycerol kinase, partial [Usitatibacter sp.]